MSWNSVGGDGGVPSGCILMWSGALDDIPDGWVLCDGSDGTPNLQDRFVVGAGTQYNVNDTGGEDEVELSEAELAPHSHGSGSLSTGSGGSHSHSIRHSETDTTDFGDHFNAEIVWEDDADETAVTESGGSHSHSVSGSTSSSGSGEAHENRPPYYALAYIMKE